MNNAMIIDIPETVNKVAFYVPVMENGRKVNLPIIVFAAPDDNVGDFIPFVKLPDEGKVFEAEWDEETCSYAHECYFVAWGQKYVVSAMAQKSPDWDDDENDEWTSLTLHTAE